MPHDLYANSHQGKIVLATSGKERRIRISNANWTLFNVKSEMKLAYSEAENNPKSTCKVTWPLCEKKKNANSNSEIRKSIIISDLEKSDLVTSSLEDQCTSFSSSNPAGLLKNRKHQARMVLETKL